MVKLNRNMVGLFFGSFNPIHIGHMILASYMVEYTDLEEVWFIISPHNPLKEKSTLLADNHRLYMVQLAVEDDARFKASDIEFKMSKPSYTIDTLTYLEEKYPKKNFALICGTDVFPTFHKWKNYQEILKRYHIFVYNRPRYKMGNYITHPRIRVFQAPYMEISASFIRNAIKEKKDMGYMLPEKVWKYIQEMHFYK